MEAQKRKLKHNWVPAHTLLSSETGSYLVCKRCGYILRADGANKDKECKGPVKIGLRKKRETKKPKA